MLKVFKTFFNYSNREMAEVMGLDQHEHNFSQKAKRKLESWGYGYTFKPRRGFQITSVPQSAEERLTYNAAGFEDRHAD